MPIKDATKEDIEAMKRRLAEAKAGLQMDQAVKMASKHKDAKRAEAKTHA
nr:MAG TPA: hypothetical protein [Caudoviricetes sp.]